GDRAEQKHRIAGHGPAEVPRVGVFLLNHVHYCGGDWSGRGGFSEDVCGDVGLLAAQRAPQSRGDARHQTGLQEETSFHARQSTANPDSTRALTAFSALCPDCTCAVIAEDSELMRLLCDVVLQATSSVSTFITLSRNES